MELTLAAVVVTALFFDFTNGFHDAANAIATSVSTRALSPRVAVGLTAVLNFAGAFVSLKVAATVGSGIVRPGSVTLTVVLAGLVGAIIWNLTSWRLGLPTSSSHALIGGIAGAALSAAGLSAVQWAGLWSKVALPSLLSPTLGVIGAAILTAVIGFVVGRRRLAGSQRVFRRLQIVSASFVAFTHGTNDAQKTMGVIALALVVASPGTKFHVPLWVIISAALAMAAGTSVGGWRIVRTLGDKLVHIQPHQGFAAETTTAALLSTTGALGFPVSTTHTITGSILGSGVASGRRTVRWSLAGSVLAAWVITMPAAALVAAAMERLSRVPEGPLVVLAVVLAAGLAAYLTRSRMPREWVATAPAGGEVPAAA